MDTLRPVISGIINRRIGGLEIFGSAARLSRPINRRIGGLEKKQKAGAINRPINRRIGGLEKPYYPVGLFQFRQNFFRKK